MDLSPMTFIDRLHLFFRPRITLLWYVLLAASWIPFFFTDIEWKPLSEVKLEDDMGAFLTMQLLCGLFLVLLIRLHRKRMDFLQKARLTWGKAKVSAETLSYVRGFQKAYRLQGAYPVNGKSYPILTGLVTHVDFEREYEFPVIYDPQHPERAKVLTELPKSIANKLIQANDVKHSTN